MKRAEEIFQGKTYSQLIQVMQAKEKNQTFGNGRRVHFAENVESKLRFGKRNGLTVVLDSNSNYLSPGSLDSDNQGFLGMIQPTGSFPLSTHGSFELRPGM